MFNIQLVAGNKIQNTAYLLKIFVLVSQKKSPARMDQTSHLRPSNLKSYGCVSLSKANKLASKILFVDSSLINFFKQKKKLNYPPRNTEGSPNSRSELSPGKWTSQTKAKNQNVFFQENNTASKKKRTDHRCT